MKRILRLKHVVKIYSRNYCDHESKWPRQIFSAIQPTGRAHLGNYLGVLKKWVDLQNSDENKVIYSIADLHSITIPKDPEVLRRNIFLMAATILACGIDTNKSILFKQSDVLQHTDLCWILGCLATVTRLSRLPQYREKCEQVKDANVGIFLYPILQAADVMLYRTTLIPVGEDQIQQIQLAQQLIRSFNNRFGSRFPVPELLVDPFSGRIKNLADPEKKMSKSDKKDTAAIYLSDEPDQILKKVKKAVTDFTSQVTFEPNVRPGVTNLILIHSAITGKSPQEIVEESVNLDTGKYKLVLAEVIIEHLNPIRKKMTEYLDSKDYLSDELRKGSERARNIAERTLKEVKKILGLDLSNVTTTKEEKESVKQMLKLKVN